MLSGLTNRTPDRSGVPASANSALGIADADVLAALKRVCRNVRRYVTCAEVTDALDHGVRYRFATRADNDLVASVRSRLMKLVRHGIVQSPGFIEQRRLFGLSETRVQPGVEREMQTSVRSSVLAMVRGAAVAARRPVRICDVVQYGGDEAIRIGNQAIGSYLTSLVTSGNLTVKHEGHGIRSGGRLHYLPVELEEAYGRATPAESFPDKVLRVFEALWTEHAREAADASRKPEPILLSEMVEQVRSEVYAEEDASPERVLSALIRLVELRQPKVRRVPMGKPEIAAWIPYGVRADACSQSAFRASDTQRAAEAVRRAHRTTGHSAVSPDEAQLEIDRDPALLMRGRESLSSTLSSASREVVDHAGRRAKRRVTYLESVGAVRGVAYYCVPEHRERAVKEVDLRRVMRREKASQLESESRRIRESVNLCIVRARAEEVVRSCQRLAHEFDGFGNDEDLCADLRELATARSSRLRAHVADVIRAFPSAHVKTTVGAETEPAFATIDRKEIRNLVCLLEDSVDDRERVWHASDALGADVRRLPNPRFQHLSSGDPETSSLTVHDRAAALMEFAERWGGQECRVNARIARRELGLCRNRGVVREAMRDRDLEHRVTAVAAAAFLGGRTICATLLRMAREDAASSVRLTAFWAFGFVRGAEANGMLRQVMTTERSDRIRGEMRRMSEMASEHKGGWWKV